MKTTTVEFNQEIEDHIDMEIVVDAYHESERAMGWYCYLQDNMVFPFKAKCIKLGSASPLSPGEIVEVSGIDADENCENDMFVKIRWKGGSLCVPLQQLEGVNVDDRTMRAITDWAYWVSQRYNF